MKKYLEYEKVKQIALTMQLPSDIGMVIGVSRGGVAFAQLLAKRFRVQMGYWIPKTDTWCVPEKPGGKDIIVAEDLVAEGRTYRAWKKSVKPKVLSNCNLYFVPLLLDANYPTPEDFPYYGFRESDWIVFPWEQMDRVQEGDRGLFREGTDLYGK